MLPPPPISPSVIPIKIAAVKPANIILFYLILQSSRVHSGATVTLVTEALFSGELREESREIGQSLPNKIYVVLTIDICIFVSSSADL
mgnify:FL=1